MWPFRSKPRAEPDITQQYLRRADEGRFEEGLPLIQEIVAKAPTISTSWFNLAICQAELGNLSQSAEAFLKTCALAPEGGGSLLRACLALAGVKRRGRPTSRVPNRVRAPNESFEPLGCGVLLIFLELTGYVQHTPKLNVNSGSIRVKGKHRCTSRYVNLYSKL